MMMSEIPSPKSDLALCVRRACREIRNPKIRSPRPHAEFNKSEIHKSGVREMGACDQSKAPQSQIRKSVVQLRPIEIRRRRVRNPKSDGALRRARRQSEEEPPLVMSLMKSDRTKAPKSDRIAGYAITRNKRTLSTAREKCRQAVTHREKS